jgi:hypothetical protein
MSTTAKAQSVYAIFGYEELILILMEEEREKEIGHARLPYKNASQFNLVLLGDRTVSLGTMFLDYDKTISSNEEFTDLMIKVLSEQKEVNRLSHNFLCDEKTSVATFFLLKEGDCSTLKIEFIKEIPRVSKPALTHRDANPFIPKNLDTPDKIANTLKLYL